MNELRIDVADLLTHPGARRPLHLQAVVDGLGGTSARVESAVTLDLLLERVPDGVVARGTVSTRYDAECGICLRSISADLSMPASELYEDHPVDGETYPLVGHVIDLEQLVRDAVLLELPLAPTCTTVGEPGCVAASDLRPAVAEAEEAEPADPRWSALSQLDL